MSFKYTFAIQDIQKTTDEQLRLALEEVWSHTKRGNDDTARAQLITGEIFRRQTLELSEAGARLSRENLDLAKRSTELAQTAKTLTIVAVVVGVIQVLIGMLQICSKSR